MNVLKEDITFKIFTACVALILLAPTLTKFVHTFEHHNHEVCDGTQKTHIHKVDLDCEFYKFQINNHFLTPSENNNWLQTNYYHKVFDLTYKFLNNHRQLSFSLRGPPVLV